MDELEKATKRIEEGDAWDDDDEIVEVDVKRPLDKVIPVRLASEQWAQLGREARELGIGPSTLARMWILERLREVRSVTASSVSSQKGTRGRKRASSHSRP
jgi:hypothetical protein